MVTRIVLVRHGVTDWNVGGIFQGQADIELNAEGRSQAIEAAPMIAHFSPTAIYSSPLKRARVTANAVADLTGLPVACDRRFSEVNVGTWAGLTYAEVMELDPEFDAAVRRCEDYRRSLTGETLTECGDRVAGALRELGERHNGENFVVASHGMAIRHGISSLFGWDFSAANALGVMGNCAVTTVIQNRGIWRLESYNRQHLPNDGQIPGRVKSLNLGG